jgi:hypothetical protein
MARHRFDPVSLVSGGLAIAVGVVVLVGGELTEEARLLLPAGLVALGVALLVRVARRPPAPAAPPPPAVPSTVLDPDDDLFAPLDPDDDLIARFDPDEPDDELIARFDPDEPRSGGAGSSGS